MKVKNKLFKSFAGLFKNKSANGIVENKAKEVNEPNTKSFVPKVEIKPETLNSVRTNVIISMQDDILPEGFQDIYNYDKFNAKYFEKYDSNGILSEDDKTAIGCLYGAYKEGNRAEWPHFSDNKIKKFVEERKGNIVKLIDLMKMDGKKEAQRAKIELEKEIEPSQLIPGSYNDVVKVIEKYRTKEEQIK